MVVSPAPCRELLVTDCRPLEQIRTDITALDSELLTLLARRRNLSLEVACSKIRDPHPVRDRQREEALLLRLISAGRELGLDAHYITRLFHVVIEDSVLHQQAFLQQRIAFLDIPGLVERALQTQDLSACHELEALLQRDADTRRQVQAWVAA